MVALPQGVSEGRGLRGWVWRAGPASEEKGVGAIGLYDEPGKDCPRNGTWSARNCKGRRNSYGDLSSCLFLAVWPQDDYLVSPSFKLLICTMGLWLVPVSWCAEGYSSYCTQNA